MKKVAFIELSESLINKLPQRKLKNGAAIFFVCVLPNIFKLKKIYNVIFMTFIPFIIINLQRDTITFECIKHFWWELFKYMCKMLHNSKLVEIFTYF